MEFIPVKPKLHVFVCVNDRSGIAGNTKPSCGPRIKVEDVNTLKEWVRSEGWTGEVYCTKASCLGFCNAEGGVACVYPQGLFVKGIRSIDEIKKLIEDLQSSR